MRSDYALYVVALICFILAAVVFTTNYTGYPLMEPLISMVTIAVLFILGIISAGAGYLIRPEEMILTPPPQPPPPKLPSETSIPPPKTKLASPIAITEIRGIGPKRAEQLRALGINTAQDLVETSASILAAKTEISPKITRKWVREAKKLIKEAS
jgi:hypothetical protein